MGLAKDAPSMYPSFDKMLPEEIYKKRHEIAIRKILEGEYTERDLNKVYGYTPPAPAATETSGSGFQLSGQAITAGMAAVLAPLLLSAFDKGKISTALKLLSMPIAALGGATLYSLLGLHSKPVAQQALPGPPGGGRFEPAYPMR